MAKTTKDMPLSGGHPALDFANTVDSRRGRWGPDLLKSYDDVIVLAQRLEVVDAAQASAARFMAQKSPRKATAALRDALRLREAIYQVFLAEDSLRPYPTDAFDIVHVHARRARSHQILSKAVDEFGWLQPIERLIDLTGVFATAAADLIISRRQRRPVRECKGDNCGWLFLDTSRGGRRLWCSDATCGAHERVKRFRTRLK